jgi:hypothetical protein
MANVQNCDSYINRASSKPIDLSKCSRYVLSFKETDGSTQSQLKCFVILITFCSITWQLPFLLVKRFYLVQCRGEGSSDNLCACFQC